MELNTGALTSGPYSADSPDIVGSFAKGSALGAELQGIMDKQQEAQKKKQVVSNLPALMGRIKENSSDFDAVSQVAQYAPGMIDYINTANKQDTEIAVKRKSELVNNLAGAYAFISSADQRGMSKEQAWQDVMKWNQAHGIDMGDLANEPYSDAALARMKGLVLGTKLLSENEGGKFSKTLQVAKDAEGNLVYVQPSEMGGAQIIGGLTPAESLISVGTGSGTQLVGSKSGKTERSIEKTLTPGEKADIDVGLQERLAAAKASGKASAEAAADKATGEAGIGQTLDIAKKLKGLAQNGYYGSTYADRAAYETAKRTGVGADDQRYLNTAAMEPLVTNLLVMSKPKGMGAMTDAEWTMLKRGIADPTQYATPQAYMKALDNFISVVEGRSKAPQKPASAPPKKPASGVKFLGFEK